MSKKISELSTIETIEDEDLIVIVDESEKATMKTTVEELLKKVEPVEYTAGEGISIEDGVISCTFEDGSEEEY